MSELVVYLGGARAGRLILKDNGNLQFRYDSEYSGPSISRALPIQEEAHPHAVCRAVFGGLLPEGKGRETIARTFGVSAGNDYALLTELGGDCAGAITLLPPEQELPTEPSTRKLSAAQLDQIVKELPQRPLAADPEAGTRLSLAGAQPKLPVIIEDGELSLPLNSAAPTTHIIKPEPEAFPGLVDNEAFCMELARGVGLPVAYTSKIRTASGIPCLLVDRYDRDLTADPIRRLHQEDFCQALGAPSDRKYQDEGGPSVRDSVALLRGASAVPAQDLPTFWRALVFNWVIGNCDAHAKNFSLLYDTGAPTLAPLYDLVSTTPYDGLERRLAMSIDGAREVDEIDAGTWDRLAPEVGYRESFAKEITHELTEAAAVQAGQLQNENRHRNDTVYDVCTEMLERTST